jgi:hypothetical protein
VYAVSLGEVGVAVMELRLTEQHCGKSGWFGFKRGVSDYRASKVCTRESQTKMRKMLRFACESSQGFSKFNPVAICAPQCLNQKLGLGPCARSRFTVLMTVNNRSSSL